MIRKEPYKAKLFLPREDELYCRLRAMAAAKLQPIDIHFAGKGSRYVEIGGFKIRFSNHEEVSKNHDAPHINCVNRDLTEEEYQRIEASLEYPRLIKKTVFAKAFGFTVPGLKKLLNADCYENVCENEYYSNTFTQYVRFGPAIEAIKKAGKLPAKHLPIAQETWTEEDYSGNFY